MVVAGESMASFLFVRFYQRAGLLLSSTQLRKLVMLMNRLLIDITGD
jgi:hypothetical protein